jgi:hypothetical protein
VLKKKKTKEWHVLLQAGHTWRGVDKQSRRDGWGQKDTLGVE